MLILILGNGEYNEHMQDELLIHLRDPHKDDVGIDDCGQAMCNKD